MNTAYINAGLPTKIWTGIDAAALLRRCAQGATGEEARAMAYVASLMHAGEPITVEEFAAARRALYAVEARLIAGYAGEVKMNRHGRPAGGVHPALL